MTEAVSNFFSAVGREFSGEKRGAGLEKSTQTGGGQGSGTPTVRGGSDFTAGGFATELGKAAVGAGATAAVASLLGPDPVAQIKPPSGLETAAQKEQKELLKAKEAAATRIREARQKVITARTAGPQTLFKREGEIPRAVKLGGGRRA